MKEKVLIVDDEISIANLIAYAFKKDGYLTEVAYDGEEALNKIESFNPNLMIIDAMMPKMDGFEVCKRLSDRANLGIIMLTAKNDIVDKVLGLELGADDYITKPFDIREIIARSRSLLRRFDKHLEVIDVQIKDLKIILKQKKVIIEGKALELTQKEFKIMYTLTSNLGRVYTREELLELIWGPNYLGSARAVDIQVQRLRSKLGRPYENMIQTVYGIGYRAIGEIDED